MKQRRRIASEIQVGEVIGLYIGVWNQKQEYGSKAEQRQMGPNLARGGSLLWFAFSPP